MAVDRPVGGVDGVRYSFEVSRTLDGDWEWTEDLVTERWTEDNGDGTERLYVLLTDLLVAQLEAGDRIAQPVGGVAEAGAIVGRSRLDRDRHRPLAHRHSEQELRQMQVALEELLRHFWLCFPVNSVELEALERKLSEALARIEQLQAERDGIVQRHEQRNQWNQDRYGVLRRELESLAAIVN